VLKDDDSDGGIHWYWYWYYYCLCVNFCAFVKNVQYIPFGIERAIELIVQQVAFGLLVVM